MSLELTIDPDDINTLIDKTLKFENTKGLMERTGRVTHTETIMNFRRSVAPDGTAWAAIKHRKGKPLVDTGRLRNSIIVESSDTEAVIGTNLIYAPVHQFGATIKPKNGKFLRFKIGNKEIFTKQVVISARPFIGFSDRLIGKINKEAEAWAQEIIDD